MIVKTQNIIKSKKTYSTPDINVVKIDNEISLVMMTYIGPGGGDDGGDPGDPNSSIQPEKFYYNPFKLPKKIIENPHF